MAHERVQRVVVAKNSAINAVVKKSNSNKLKASCKEGDITDCANFLYLIWGSKTVLNCICCHIPTLCFIEVMIRK